ncbi:hypothetical protein TNCV_494511 [Trichonephila clavipes]|nr:hypothetical protein TNCV_494511 [Trichonephila clavipes]
MALCSYSQSSTITPWEESITYPLFSSANHRHDDAPNWKAPNPSSQMLGFDSQPLSTGFIFKQPHSVEDGTPASV